MEQKRNWWSILFWVAFACVGVVMSVKSSIVSIDTGRSQTRNSTQTTEYHKTASNSASPSAGSDAESSPAKQFMNELQTQDAEAVFAYLKDNESLEATWVSNSKELRSAFAAIDEDRAGFGVQIYLPAMTETGAAGATYKVVMMDDNADGVLDHIMYTNVLNREDEHIYHQPTDEASTILWEVSLRELAKATR